MDRLDRRYPLPLRPLGLVALAAGCAPPVAGTWTLSALQVNNEDVELERSFSYGGVDIDQVLAIELVVQPDLRGTLTSRLERTPAPAPDAAADARAYTYTYTYVWSGEGLGVGDRSYDLDLAALDEAREDLALTCTVEDDALECDGENGDDDVEMEFVEG